MGCERGQCSGGMVRLCSSVPGAATAAALQSPSAFVLLPAARTRGQTRARSHPQRTGGPPCLLLRHQGHVESPELIPWLIPEPGQMLLDNDECSGEDEVPRGTLQGRRWELGLC